MLVQFQVAPRRGSNRDWRCHWYNYFIATSRSTERKSEFTSRHLTKHEVSHCPRKVRPGDVCESAFQFLQDEARRTVKRPHCPRIPPRRPATENWKCILAL